MVQLGIGLKFDVNMQKPFLMKHWNMLVTCESHVIGTHT